MSGYERITEDQHAATAAECRVCDSRTTHRQDADGSWVCQTCEINAREEVIEDLLAHLRAMLRLHIAHHNSMTHAAARQAITRAEGRS